MNQTQLTGPDLKSHFVKKVKANVWKFSGEKDTTDDEILKNLTLALKSPKVQRLEIDCRECENVTDRGLEFLGRALRRMTCLKSISLDFDSCPSLGDKGLKSLSKNLKNLTSLQSLSLNISMFTQITDEGLRSLSKCLKRLPSLKVINLNFSSYILRLKVLFLNC